MKQFRYVRCKSLEQAGQYLGEENSKILAGGTDLLVDLKNKKINPRLVVDISSIPGLDYIKQANGYIGLGALVTHADATKSDLIKKYAKVLAEACATVGSPQIRNMGTIVGNVMNAQPAADAAVALHALDAELKVWQDSAEQWVPVAKAYLGPGKSALAGQLVTAVRFRPLHENQGSSFKRIARRGSLALPILNTAVVVEVKDNKFVKASIFAAPVSPVPARMEKAEQYLEGKPVESDVLKEAGALVSEQAEPRDSLFRGARDYRKDVISSLVVEALEDACQEALRKRQ